MGFLSGLEHAGKTLADLSGGTAIARAVEHPLNWKNDAMAGIVLASYLAGGPLARGAETVGLRGAEGLAARLFTRRASEAAPAQVGTALHAAWGNPTGVSPTALIAKLLGKKAAGNSALTETKTSGMFFTPFTDRTGARVPFDRGAQDSIADRATQAMEQQRGEFTAIDPQYDLSKAGQNSRIKLYDRAYPTSFAPTGQTTQKLVANSKPMWGFGLETPNTGRIDAGMLQQLLRQMGYTKRGLNG